VYKRRSFSRRSLQEILDDIDAAAGMLQELRELSSEMGSGGEIDQRVLNRVFTDSRYSEQHRYVAYWAYAGSGNVFIQDANSLIMRSGDMAEALRHLRRQIPEVRRVTTYGRSNTIARKSPEEMRSLKEAGLDRIHVGMESGSDKVLQYIRKGCTAEQQIRAGRLVVEAGMSLSEYIMPGLGGRELSREHALETARVLNAIDPDYIRLRTLHIKPGTPLHEEYLAGNFHPLPEDDIVREIRLLIENLQGIRSTLASDHIMNLLEEVQGTFPEDRDKMLRAVDAYLELPEEERLLYRLGRRGGALRYVSQLRDPGIRSQLEQARKELLSREGGDLDSVISELGRQYI
jgi:histone acetyltransferase (RNA polymerase elongator complex component)